ncbi:DNA cytosine methyltransferase [Pleomorphomonas koreensis]|uniref:DNA cytosine methyltransferase n=1 Tax=Pleomorphomonas koreensis TaxID=257440 RepID=UPI00041419A8|nr:DNA cytosine methyltransferase [Pleomorphomonas koreensis]
MNAPLRPRMLRELKIDSFAGGGGASEGIRIALGCDPDIAVNHDDMALAMHRINHPGTHHLVQDVAVVDAVGLCDGLPIGMLWMSPDCTDHSKAKGSAPLRDADRTTRGIGWAIVGWVKALPMWQRPRVVFLENVEEYEHWGPLLPNGKRDPARKGEIFNQFVGAWRALGYKKIEWRQRRAWKSGAGTIRNRLYMIMRRDDEPIVWPEPTHGNPNDAADAARIAAGKLKPWVTVAEGIDFNLPCPSIFATAEEIKTKFGIRAKRPLARNTLGRVAKGVKRRVLDAPRPFMVKVNHSSAARDDARDRPSDAPLSAMTGVRDDAIVAPHVAYAQHGGNHRPATLPGQTITASPKDQNQVVSAFLAPRLQEKAGDEPRSRSVDLPAATIPASDSLPGHLVSAIIARQFGNSISNDADAPSGTLVAGGDGKSQLVAAYMAQQNDGPRQGAMARGADEPLSTVTTKGSQQTVIAAAMATMRNSGLPDSPADQSGRTLVADGAAETLIAASMLTLRGSSRREAGADEPSRTISAGGNHNALVSLPLMTVYYGTDDDGASVDEPSRTETAKPRFGLAEVLASAPPFGPEYYARARQVAEFLRSHGCWDGGEFVTIEVDGLTFVLIDIGMRMLTPRERFNAQGFRRDYVIDHGIDEHGRIVRFTLEQQGYMCGNSVCPTEAAALVAANYRPREVMAPASYEAADMPLFMEAAE